LALVSRTNYHPGISTPGDAMTSQREDSEAPPHGTVNPGRRRFIARSLAAGVAVAAGSAVAAEAVVETDVTIKARDGTCDAAFVHPATGAHPGVLIWPDALGLRPTMRAMARRLAADGYAVLVPNPFYRVSKAPQFETAANLDFRDQSVMAKVRPLMASVNAAGAAESDALAYIAFLDAQPPVDRAKKIGTQGYCMGGALVMRTAATVPDRVGAGASFHGGGLVTDAPDSPHLLAPKIKARMLIAIASNDDQRQPDAKTKLEEAFAKASVPAEVEVYPARHGWCVPDMPIENGAPIYSAPEAERAWGRLIALYRTALA
jgi:carboxymethylenebutenolidase